MKMKDVITETGLTDRAIRLYIENSLTMADICIRFSPTAKITVRYDILWNIMQAHA
jgi:hypothetical protein